MSSTHEQCALSEAPSHRSYFHVGGHYRNTGAGESQHVMTGQMYVEKLIPVDGVKRPLPLVFIHGAGQTGSVSPISSSLLAVLSRVSRSMRWLHVKACVMSLWQRA